MSTKPYEAQLETALTQCQHVSHDALVDLERGDLVEPMERAKAALERVQEIAETGEADRDFVAMLERERLAEEIIPGVTVGSTEADMAEAGAMSTSDGLGAAALVEQKAVQACFNLAEYLNAQDSWNGGDVCEVLAQELRNAGHTID